MRHAVVSHREWIAARRKLLAKEKEFTRLRDELTRVRQALPWERVEKEYQFQGPRGKVLYNYKKQDPGVTDREGLSVFYRAADGSVFHTYSTFARGIDMFSTDYNYLDVVPKGRDEGGKGPYWVKRHGEY